MPASSSAVSVSFFYDSSRSLYRIISVEGQKAVINSTVTPNMTFTKTSQKFGQWSDVRANTVYGLGFSSEAELQKVSILFHPVMPITPTSKATAGDDDLPHPRSHSMSGVAGSDSPSHGKISGDKYSGTGSNHPIDMQLKYENDRLKLALAQSSANAKKWEIELATLKSNNARLTSALQESTANVDEWKRQLASLKEENMRMKSKYQSDLENSKGGGDIADELRKEIHSLRIRVEQLESELEGKNNEIKMLMSSNKHAEIQALQKENHELQSSIKLAQAELEIALSAHESQKQVMMTLNTQLAARIHELATIHDEMSTAIQT
nr:unnamed protein product [Callosobruchus chinensis]